MAKIEFKTLEQFMPYWCQKILPAVYDDSLSYYQLLGRILQKYNEVIEIVNKHSETLVDHENRITAAEAQIELNRQAIEALKAELAKLDEQVKQNTANIAALTDRVNQHDADILALQNAVKALQGNNSDWRASVILSGANIHEMRFVGTVKEIKFSEWGDFIKGGNVVFPVIDEGNNKIVGTVAVKITSNGIFNAYGCVIKNAHLHYFTATYSAVGHTVAYGETTDWTEVELLDITNIKQSLGTGEYDVVSQKVLTQILNGKLSIDMGITGATAGSYINIATVDDDGKPLTYGFGTPGGGGAGVDIVQTPGQSTTSVMSQKATTDAINAVKTIANQIAASVVYPTTAGGTNGKFVDTNGTTLTRTQLLAALMGADGKNAIFTVKKTGATSWDRITWFKASAGEGLYDFAWYETDGTNAKAGVDRLTMATNGQFAVSEQSSVDLGGGSGIDISLGVTGAAVDDFIQASGVSNGKPTGWKKISVSEMAMTISHNAYNLGTVTGTYPFPSASNENITIPIPSSWVGKTREEVINLISSGAFMLTVSRTSGSTGNALSVTVYCREGYKISDERISQSQTRLYVTGATWGDYEDSGNVNKKRLKISYTSLATELSKRISASDTLAGIISSDLRKGA